MTVVDIGDADNVIALLKKHHFTTIATSSHAGDLSLYELSKGPKVKDKMVLFLGEERTGLKEQTLKGADLRLTIPGTNHVESLNVASTAAILLSHLYPIFKK